MKRLLLAAAIAATAFAVAPAADAGPCVGGHTLGACVNYGCTGHPCVLDPTSATVSVSCNHPTPPRVCALLYPQGS